ncbi:MAG: hypothetical protein ACQJCO_01510 [cyanobacterium endosymbiont of Rhopalodia sterrenbergii]
MSKKLTFYDYVRNGWTKSSLFSTRAMDSGDKIAQAWFGHSVFTCKEGRELTVCRIFNSFEIFLIVLTDAERTVCTDIPCRCAEQCIRKLHQPCLSKINCPQSSQLRYFFKPSV